MQSPEGAEKSTDAILKSYPTTRPSYCTFDLNLLSGPWKLRITGIVTLSETIAGHVKKKEVPLKLREMAI